MAEMTLSLRPALTGFATAGRHGRMEGSAGIRLRVVSDFAAFYLSGRKGQGSALARQLAEIFAADVPDRPGRTAKGVLSITGISPGQWRLVVRGSKAGEEARALMETMASSAITVSCGDGLMLVEVTGDKARAALAKGIPVDLDGSVFKPGSAAQTSASHIGLHIAAIDEGPGFELIAAASTAGSLWSWLTASCAEFGYEVIGD